MPIVSIPQFHSKPTDETKEGGFHVVERNECLGKDQPQVMVSRSDAQMIRKVHQITDKGNNAEVKKAKDGTLTVYDVSKSIQN